MNTLWTFLGIASIVLLVIYFRRGQNAVWGGFTGGIIIGIVVALLSSGFNWFIVGKGAVLGTLIGFIAELLGVLSDYLRKRT
jgi:uncharacterized membrane protein